MDFKQETNHKRGKKAKKIVATIVSLVVIFGLGAYGLEHADTWASTTNKTRATTKFVPRPDTSEAIDKEFNDRFHKMVAQADKQTEYTPKGMILKHKYGETLIPKNPQRVVVVRMEDQMLALHAPMIAATNRPGYYLHDQLAALPIATINVNDDTKTINLEQVQALHPDLIIIRDIFSKSTYDALSKIAPVAAFNQQASELSLLTMARTLGMKERGEERLREYYAVAKSARMDIKGKVGDSEFAFFRVLNKDLRLYPYSSNNITKFLYELLNLTPDAMTLAMDGNESNTISIEMVPDIKAKYLIVSTGYGTLGASYNEAADEQYKSLQQDPLWKLVPAVQEHHIFNIDANIWNMHGIIAKETAMKQLQQWILKQP